MIDLKAESEAIGKGANDVRSSQVDTILGSILGIPEDVIGATGRAGVEIFDAGAGVVAAAGTATAEVLEGATNAAAEVLEGATNAAAEVLEGATNVLKEGGDIIADGTTTVLAFSGLVTVFGAAFFGLVAYGLYKYG